MRLRRKALLGCGMAGLLVASVVTAMPRTSPTLMEKGRSEETARPSASAVPPSVEGRRAAPNPEVDPAEQLRLQTARIKELANAVIGRLEEEVAAKEREIEQEIVVKHLESDVEEARRNQEIAGIALKKYLEIDFPLRKKAIEVERNKTALTLSRARNHAEWVKNKLDKKLFTPSVLEDDLIVLGRAEQADEQVAANLQALENFEKPMQVAQLKGAVERAKSDLQMKQSSYQLEHDRLSRLKSDAEHGRLTENERKLLVMLSKLLDRHRQIESLQGEGPLTRSDNVAEGLEALRSEIDRATGLWEQEQLNRAERRLGEEIPHETPKTDAVRHD